METDGPGRSGVSEQTEQPGQPEPPGQPAAPGEPRQPAPPERPGRYERSPGGMVGALIVTLLVIGAFVAFRAFNRTDLDVKPEHVDYLAQVRIAQQATERPDAGVVYPARLPSGWYATNVTFTPNGTRPELRMSMLTPDNEYIGFVQSPDPVAGLLTTYVDAHPQAGGPVTVDGSVTPRWDTWTDSGGDTALAAQHGRDSLLVFGTVSKGQLEQLAATLTTAPVAG